MGGRRWAWVISAAAISCLPTVAQGQGRAEPDSFLNQQRTIERLIQDQRAALDVPAEGVGFDYGGYYSFFLFLYDDGTNSSRTFRRHDLRIWSRLTLDNGAHEFYARSRLGFVDFNPGDDFGTEDDVEGMDLERGFYKFDLAKAVRAKQGGTLPYNVEFKIGRDFTEFGTGLVLSRALDQVHVTTTYGPWQARWLAGKTVGSSQDLDIGRDVDRTRRSFLGVDARYKGFERHEPFAYLLWQRDHNTDNVPTLFQKFDYDSFYVGLGSTGEVVTNLRYSTEWVFETGHSYGDRRFLHKNRINAWAWDIGLEYLMPGKGSPRMGVEYIFASGEPDRLFSPTDAVGGVSRGHRDEGFNGFGYRDTGLSFAPTLSNVHVWRAGTSFFPFEDHDYFKRLELGTNWFLYYKHHADAAVSDPLAGVQSGYLGWEMDYFANWDITSDVAATTRYGVFFPGKAFEDQTTRTYLLFGLTWNF